MSRISSRLTAASIASMRLVAFIGENSPPGLSLEIEPHPSVFIRTNVQLFGIWRSLWSRRAGSGLRGLGLRRFARLTRGLSWRRIAFRAAWRHLGSTRRRPGLHHHL